MAKKVTEIELINVDEIMGKIWTPLTGEEYEEELRLHPEIKRGTEIFGLPPIETDPEKAFNQFKELYGKLSFAHELIRFKNQFPSGSQKAIRETLNEIEGWMIAKEKECKYIDATIDFKTRKILNEKDEGYEYIRLKSGFYFESNHINDDWEPQTRMTRVQHNLFSTAANVYGRYFLFKDWLKSKIIELSEQQKTIIRLYSEGKNSTQIAAMLYRGNGSTVRTALSEIKAKTEIHDINEIAAQFL